MRLRISRCCNRCRMKCSDIQVLFLEIRNINHTLNLWKAPTFNKVITRVLDHLKLPIRRQWLAERAIQPLKSFMKRVQTQLINLEMHFLLAHKMMDNPQPRESTRTYNQLLMKNLEKVVQFSAVINSCKVELSLKTSRAQFLRVVTIISISLTLLMRLKKVPKAEVVAQ